MLTFRRAAFSNLIVKLRSDEPLSNMIPDYLEDYYGEPGQISLHHESGARSALIMTPAPEVTPDIPNDVFRGVIDLANMLDGSYSIEGRVMDRLGNLTIIGAYHDPEGTERVVSLAFVLRQGYEQPIVEMGPLFLSGALAVALPFSQPGQRAPADLSARPIASMNLNFSASAGASLNLNLGGDDDDKAA